jgi:hypothetical protein
MCPARIVRSMKGTPLKNKKKTYVVWLSPSALTKISTTDGASTSPASPPVEEGVRVAEGDGMRVAGGEGVRTTEASRTAEGGSSLPTRAAHERERSMPQLPPAPVRGRQQAERKTPESKVALEKRIEQFPNTSLVITMGRLHCACCKYNPPNKWSSINIHIQSPKHAANYKAWLTRCADDKELKEDLLAYYCAHPNEALACVQNPDEMVYRYRTTETFLKAGVGLAVCDVRSAAPSTGPHPPRDPTLIGPHPTWDPTLHGTPPSAGPHPPRDPTLHQTPPSTEPHPPQEHRTPPSIGPHPPPPNWHPSIYGRYHDGPARGRVSSAAHIVRERISS